MKRTLSVYTVFGLILLLGGCRTARDTGVIWYDPPGATTLTKPVLEQHHRMIGFSDSRIWVSNEFDGGRLNDFYRVNDTLYQAVFIPENAPINWSAWYAFKIWSEKSQIVNINLAYENGRHRYYPKLSSDGLHWSPIDSTAFRPDSLSGTAIITVEVGPEPLYVSAQELITSSFKDAWTESLMKSFPVVERSVVGLSHRGRPVYRLTVNETGNMAAPAILIFGRQHPPEVTGSLAMKTFVETLLDSTDTAKRFRERFQIVMYPLMNPDGVDMGHWRHNAGGVDLNRDWNDFNQPETAAVRDDLLKLKSQNVRVYYGFDFHSTAYDVFYTIRKDIPTWPDTELTDRWLAGIAERLPDYEIREEAFGVASPINKNWVYHTFGSAAVTYEVGDNTPRDLLRDVARAAADSMMMELIRLITES